MSDNIGRNNEWALLIHSHIPIGKAPADLGPLIKAVISHADAEQDKILAQWERAHDRMAKALADARAKVARVEVAARAVLQADDGLVTYEPCSDCLRSGVVLVTGESDAAMDDALDGLRAALAGPEPDTTNNGAP
jgi:uncharacterized protein YqfA (UPF0365 family)